MIKLSGVLLRSGVVLWALGWLVGWAWGAAVAVSELPRGEREVSAACGFGVQRLLFAADGTLLSWTDAFGNAQLSSPGTDWDGARYAVEVQDAESGNARLYPRPQAALEITPLAQDQIQATVTLPDATRVSYLLTPDRLGLRISGPRKSYLLLGRRPARMEGCRVDAPPRPAISPPPAHARWPAPRRCWRTRG